MEQKIFTFDSQMLNTFQACARKYDYSFIQNVHPPEKAEALEKGDLMHKMLEVYYSLQLSDFKFDTPVWNELLEAGFQGARGFGKQGFNFPESKTFPKIQQFALQAGQYFSTKLNLPTDEANETIHQFQEYTNHYEHDSWRPLAVEEVGSRILYEDEEIKLIYNFKIDLIAEMGNIIAPFDHKTSKRREEPSSMSNQFIGYCFGLNLNNIVVNNIGFQKTLSPSQRFNRFILPIDDDRINEWKENTIYWARAMMHAIESNYFPMNLTSCDKYSGCIFRKLCESSPEGREWKIQRDYKIGETWDVAKELEVK